MIQISDKVSIDSCKLRIPLSCIEVINPELTDKWAEVSENGEVDPKGFKRRSLRIKEKGVTTSYAIVSRKCYGQIEMESLLILFNSKLLGASYFDGINSDNIQQVYLAIIEQKVVKVSFEAFLSGALTDTDIKKDFIVGSVDNQIELVQYFGKRTKLSKSKAGGHDMRNNENNVGIQWSKREVATDGKPHVKMYAKDLELRNSSNEFWQSALAGQDLPSIMRLEGTIKNKKHFKYMMGQKENEFQQFTLHDILGLDPLISDKALSQMFLRHLDSDMMETNKMEGLSQSELIAKGFLEHVGSLAKCKVWVTDNSSTKQQAHRIRKLFDKVWHECIDGYVKEAAKASDEVIDFVFGTKEGKHE